MALSNRELRIPGASRAVLANMTSRAAAPVAESDINDGAVTPLKIDSSDVVFAADDDIEIGPEHHGKVLVMASVTGAKTITTNADVEDGMMFHAFMLTRSGGSYALALGNSQTATFDAALERCSFYRVNGAWYAVAAPVGATIA